MTGVSLADLTEEELMARLGRGEMEPLGELYMRHAHTVGQTLRRHAAGLPAADLEELRQEVFLSLAAGAVRYREQGRFQAWLYGIALRKAREWGRSAALRRRLLAARKGERVGLAWEQDSSPARTVELREDVARALAELPPGQREVLTLRAAHGYSAEEIGKILGLKPEAVWTRLHRARRALVERLEQPTAENDEDGE